MCLRVPSSPDGYARCSTRGLAKRMGNQAGSHHESMECRRIVAPGGGGGIKRRVKRSEPWKTKRPDKHGAPGGGGGSLPGGTRRFAFDPVRPRAICIWHVPLALFRHPPAADYFHAGLLTRSRRAPYSSSISRPAPFSPTTPPKRGAWNWGCPKWTAWGSSPAASTTGPATAHETMRRPRMLAPAHCDSGVQELTMAQRP